MFYPARYPTGHERHTAPPPGLPEEIAEALSFALRYDGRKRMHDADPAMGRITADRLVRHLERSGFVVMKAAPAPAPTTAAMPPP